MSDAVSWDRIPPILESIGLERIRKDARDVRFPLSYAGFNTESLLRTHILPYLAPLKSERALAFELAERPELQTAVGLTDGRIPSRATLWHFRHRNLATFRCLMIRSLVVIAIDAHRSGAPLPFVIPEDLTQSMRSAKGDSVLSDSFDDPETGARLYVYTNSATRPRKVKESAFLPLPGFTETVRVDAPGKIWLHQVLDFPIFARWHADMKSAELCLVQPSWLNSPYEMRDLGAYLGRSGKDPYTACNVLVLRNECGCEEVLLSKRRIGSGAGSFAVPGGKKLADESVVECVKRELQEEVGIEYRAGRPISYRETNEPGFPKVRSIGIAATSWHGKPRRVEHLAHSEWNWYPLSNLPEPLFFPTEIAIKDYIDKLFVDLDWDTVDPRGPLPLWSY
jgi:8-oxo-dGTP diphosphatase